MVRNGLAILLIGFLLFACVSATRPEVPPPPLTMEELQRLAASDDDAAKRVALPSLVEALSSTNRMERLLAFMALAGPEGATGSVLLDEPLSDRQLCPSLVAGLQNVWSPEDQYVLDDLDEYDYYLENKEQLIFALFDRQSCVNISDWLWRQCINRAEEDGDVCTTWIAAHASAEDNEQLLRLAGTDSEPEYLRVKMIDLLSKRPLSLDQRRQALSYLKELSLDEKTVKALVNAEPNLPDETILQFLHDETLGYDIQMVMARELSSTCPIEARWELVCKSGGYDKVRAELVIEVLPYWDTDKEAFFINDCREQADWFCWDVARYGLVKQVAQNRQAFMDILYNVMSDRHMIQSIGFLYSDLAAEGFAQMPLETRLMLNGIYSFYLAEYIALVIPHQEMIDYIVANSNLGNMKKREGDEDYENKRRQLEEELAKAEERWFDKLKPYREVIREHLSRAAVYRLALKDRKSKDVFNGYLDRTTYTRTKILFPVLEEEMKHGAQLRRKYGKLLKNPPYIAQSGIITGDHAQK
ncbi:MAG TPA: hypothetical protein PKW95_06890 [bacterium]|nr:hypothetical protein [bacterium]